MLLKCYIDISCWELNKVVWILKVVYVCMIFVKVCLLDVRKKYEISLNIFKNYFGV